MTGPSKAIDLLHAELLSDVIRMAEGVEHLKSELPDLLRKIEIQTQGAKNASQQARVNVENSALVFSRTLKKQLDEERSAVIKSLHSANLHTSRSLARFSIYFWVLAGVTSVQALLFGAFMYMTVAV